MLTILWFSPVWLGLGTPVSLDFLLDSPPLDASVPPGYVQKNYLLNDIPLQMLPWREATVRAWRAGSLPVLDRHASGGTPLWENLQAAVLYPPNLLSIPFTTFCWPLFVGSAKVLAALVGMYLLLRELTRGHVPAVFGAIAWGFGAFTISYLMFPHSSVTTLLPLLMFFFVRRANGNRQAIVWAALTLVVMFTGGHPESLFHCALVALPWCVLLVVRAQEHRLRMAFDYIAAGLIALAVSAPLLVPFAAYLPHSQRLGDLATSEGFLWTPPFGIDALITFLIPNYFGSPIIQNYRHAFNFNELCSQFAGLSTLVFAIGATLLRPRRYAAGISLFIALFLLSTQPQWLQQIVKEIPLLDVTAHSRLRFALAFLMVVAGADGFERFFKDQGRRHYAIIAAALFATVSVVCLASYPIFAHFGTRRLVFFTEITALAGCALIVLMWLRPRMLSGPILVGLLFVDLFSVVGLYNPRNGPELYYPAVPPIQAMIDNEPPYRVSGLARAFQQNQAVFHGLEDVRPHDPMAYQPYVHMLDRAGLDRSTYFEMFNSMPRENLLDFLGARFVIAPPKAESSLPLTHEGSGARVFRNDGALPRYFVPTQVIATSDPLTSFLESDQRWTVFAEGAHEAAPATVDLSFYGPSSSTLIVVAQAETFVASSEVALPGWELLRDGQPWPLIAINGVFLGWKAPVGESEFTLRYRPAFLAESTAISLVALILLAVWWLHLRQTSLRTPTNAPPVAT